jgi:hypothetical protein
MALEDKRMTTSGPDDPQTIPTEPSVEIPVAAPPIRDTAWNVFAWTLAQRYHAGQVQ